MGKLPPPAAHTLGENGAGKSTIMKVLAGVNTVYNGKIWFKGQEIIARSVHEQRERGVSIIMNNLKAEGGFVETYVGIDQYKSAALAGEYAANNLPGGKVLPLEGIAEVDAHDQRLNGFKDQIAGKPGFQISASLAAHCGRNEAYNVMQDVLTRYPDVNLVWAINAEMGQGAIRAIEEAKKTGITVFDFDNSKDDSEAIKAGTLAGSIDQYPASQARAAIQACLDVLAGKKLPPKTETNAELITKANVR